MKCRMCELETYPWMDVGFEVRRCSCGFVGSYVDVSDFYKEYGWESEYKDQPQIEAELSLLKPGDLLEVGCNSGTFLEAARLKGFNVYGIDASPDVVRKAQSKGFDVRQGYFGPGTGKVFDVFVARHVLEHVINLKDFAQGIRESVWIGGRVLIEVPDFEFYAMNRDYSCFWKQHVNYFTEDSLRSFFKMAGLKVKEVRRFDFSGRSLMMLGERDLDYIGFYAESLPDFKDEAHRLIKNLSKKNKIALYGAGCRAETLVNLLGVRPYISKVFDDHPYKLGKPFLGQIVQKPDFKGIDVCLLGVNEENEEKVKSRHKFKGFVPFFKNFVEVMKMPCDKKMKRKMKGKK